MTSQRNLIKAGKTAIQKEIAALQRLEQTIGNDFAKACQIVLSCHGKVILLGLGKSGLIAKKIAATLASTGTPAFFIHASEACHGDLGMVSTNDMVIAISHSGYTHELLALLPRLRNIEVPVISITSNSASPLAIQSQLHLSTHVTEEAEPLDLAPTTSTTTTLALGDALAIALLQARNFAANDFASVHPAGSLGKRLLLTANDLMHTDEQLPLIYPDSSISNAIIEMTNKRLGATCVVDQQQLLLGIFTDGDLRRAIEQQQPLSTAVVDCMTTTQLTASAQTLVLDLFNTMECHKITVMPIVDANKHCIGLVHLHDILATGIL